MGRPSESPRRLLVATEARFTRSPNGDLYAPAGVGAAFFDRYRQHYDHVTVLARVFPDDQEHGDVVDPTELPIVAAPVGAGIPGLASSLGRRGRRAVAHAVAAADGVIVRLPGAVGLLAAGAARRSGTPYVTELVGDPEGAVREALDRRPGAGAVAAVFAAATARASRRGVAVAAVHQGLLARYGTGNAADTTYSSIDLPLDQVVGAPRSAPPDGPVHLACVASLSVPYKGVDDLIDSVPSIERALAGRQFRVSIVGSGLLEPDLRARAERVAGGLVHFTGQLPSSAAVMAFLDDVDVLVHPARTEGLPRAIVEAQARGVPVVATAVGGSPTLVPDRHLVPARRPETLAVAIAGILDPEAYRAASAAGLASASEFTRPELEGRRRGFYEALRDAGERT